MDGVWSTVYKQRELIDLIDEQWATHELADDDLDVPVNATFPAINTDINVSAQGALHHVSKSTNKAKEGLRNNNNNNSKERWDELALGDFLKNGQQPPQ